jgi:hypothetical protein
VKRLGVASLIQSLRNAGLGTLRGHLQVAQAALFYEFLHETRIPADHLLRATDRFLELGN